MPRNRLIPALTLAGVLAALGAWYALGRLSPPALNGTLLPAGAPAELTLQAAGREDVSLSDFRGRAILLFFGYTSCPDACPLTMAKLTRVMDALGERRANVQVLLVTVDPATDTRERLRAYAKGFDPSFIGLGGEPAQLKEAAAAFGAFAGEAEQAPQPGATAGGHAEHGAPATGGAPASHADPARLIPHTSHVFGIDRSGRFRVLWSPDLGAEEIAADVRALLRL